MVFQSLAGLKLRTGALADLLGAGADWGSFLEPSVVAPTARPIGKAAIAAMPADTRAKRAERGSRRPDDMARRNVERRGSAWARRRSKKSFLVFGTASLRSARPISSSRYSGFTCGLMLSSGYPCLKPTEIAMQLELDEGAMQLFRPELREHSRHPRSRIQARRRGSRPRGRQARGPREPSRAAPRGPARR